jgi:rhodanese-related sulfurtransferase
MVALRKADSEARLFPSDVALWFAVIGLAAACGCSTTESMNRYSNQTVSLSLTTISAVPETEAAVSNPPSRSGPLKAYANETRSISFATIAPAPGINQIRAVQWPEVKALLATEALLLIDARGPQDYLTRHIPGALSIPAETSDADLQIAVSQYAKNQPIVVYCASIACATSRSFAQRLVNFGFTNVQDMPGGFAEYLRSEPGQK